MKFCAILVFLGSFFFGVVVGYVCRMIETDARFWMKP